MSVEEPPVAGCNVCASGEQKMMKRSTRRMFEAGALALTVAAVVPPATAHAQSAETGVINPGGPIIHAGNGGGSNPTIGGGQIEDCRNLAREQVYNCCVDSALNGNAESPAAAGADLTSQFVCVTPPSNSKVLLNVIIDCGGKELQAFLAA